MFRLSLTWSNDACSNKEKGVTEGMNPNPNTNHKKEQIVSATIAGRITTSKVLTEICRVDFRTVLQNLCSNKTDEPSGIGQYILIHTEW